MRQAVFFRLRLRLSLQNTAALPTPILSLNLGQRLGGSQYVIEHKTGNYRRFSWNMQRMEADIFVDSVYANLASLKIPALTVHDSVGIPISHAKRIKKLLLDELSKRGYKVKIKDETPAHTI